MLSALVPLIVTTLTLVGGGIVYIYQKRWDRQENLRSQKLELYSKYLLSVDEMIALAGDYSVVKDGGVDTLKAGDAVLSNGREHTKLKTQVDLYASVEIGDAIASLESALWSWRELATHGKQGEVLGDRFDKLQNAKYDLISKIRIEIHG